MAQLLGVLEQGLIYAVLALGVYITFKILDFPDMTVDSSFPLGAAVSAILTVNGMHPVLTLLMATLAGAAAGLVTGLIHVKCRVRDLLSGIITMTGLYSINLRIAGRANLPFFNMDTLFDNALVDSLPAALAPWSKVLVVLVIVLVVKVLLDLFMNTKAGFLLRAEGDNPAVVATLARDGGLVKIEGLIIANALVALMDAFVALGGFFMQIDIMDADALRAARENPQAYKSLSVRVSGWNARFVTLNEEWQNMVIERTARGM